MVFSSLVLNLLIMISGLSVTRVLFELLAQR